MVRHWVLHLRALGLPTKGAHCLLPLPHHHPRVHFNLCEGLRNCHRIIIIILITQAAHRVGHAMGGGECMEVVVGVAWTTAVAA